MKKHHLKNALSVALLTLILTTSKTAFARDKSDYTGLEGFVDGCTELVHIYETRNQKRLLAAQTTSLSEALRAGYCRGVIEQYKQQKRCYEDWYDIAEFVARQNGVENKFGNINSVLERACNVGW